MTVNQEDVIRVTARLKYRTLDDVQNVYYVKYEGATPLTDSAARNDLEAWLEDIYGEFSGGMPEELTFEDLTFFNYTQDAPMSDGDWPFLVQGGSATDELPSGVAAVATASTGKKNTRSRKFWGPLTEALTTDGEWLAGTLSDLADAAATWITTFVGDQSGLLWRPGVKTSAEEWQFWPLAEAVVRAIPAYMRKRKQGKGS
jgi:hypothetical protein